MNKKPNRMGGDFVDRCSEIAREFRGYYVGSPLATFEVGYRPPRRQPPSEPLVLGTSELRGSSATACRSAFAVALKIASDTW